MKTNNLGFLNRLTALLILCSLSLFASIGKITAVNGQVSIERGGKTIEAKAGVDLNQKDTIKSKASSNAQLLFADQTVITVGPNSSFGIEEYVNDDKNPSAKFKAGDGAFKAITGKIGKLAPDKFKVETKTATIGIRGTRLIIISMAGIETYACTKGTITAAPKVIMMAPAPGAQSGQPTPVPQQQQQEPVVIIIKSGQMTTASGGQIQPARPFTPAELKQLEKSTDSGVKTTSVGQTTNIQTQEEAKTPVLVLQGSVVEGLVKSVVTEVSNLVNDAGKGVRYSVAIEIFKDLTAEDKKIVDTVLQQVGNTASTISSSIPSVPTTPPQPTLFSALPSSGIYRYMDDLANWARSTNEPDVAGIPMSAQRYVNMQTKKGVHIERIFNGTGYDLIFGLGALDSNATGYAISSSSTYVGNQYGNFVAQGTSKYAGATGEYGTDSYSNYTAQSSAYVNGWDYGSVRVAVPTVSAVGDYSMSGFTIGAKYNKSSGVYPVITGSGASTAIVQINTQASTGLLLSGTGITDTDVGATLTVDTSSSNNAYVNNSLMGGLFNGNFNGAAISNLSWMASLPIMRGGILNYTDDDAMTWGYWKADTDYSSGLGYSGFGYWVAGQPFSGTMPASITNYQGSVLGSVITSGNQVQDILQNGSNIMAMQVAFGSGNAITGNIQFQTSAATGNSWNVNYSGYTMSSGIITSGTPAFSGTAGASSLSSGFIKGQCYGADCVGVGGSFGLQNSNPDKAFGVFRLKKQ